MGKRLFAFLTLGLCLLCLPAAAQEKVRFTASYVQNQDGSVDVQVSTDATVAVGGIYLALEFPREQWRVEPGSVATKLKQADAAGIQDAGQVRLVWDTAQQGQSLPQELLSARFVPVDGQSPEIAAIVPKLVEFYDNTPQMNDIPYEINTDYPESHKGVSGVVLCCGLALAAAVTAVLLGLRRRKK